MNHLKKINTEIAFLNTVYKYSAFVYIVCMCIFYYLNKAHGFSPPLFLQA